MPVYILYKATGTTEAGYQLTDKQREDLQKKIDQAIGSVGGKRVAVYRSAVDGKAVSILSYPSLEAAEKVRVAVMSREGLNWGRYETFEADILYEVPLSS